MIDEKPKNSITDIVMEKIKNKQEKMRPRWYFIIISTIIIITLIIIILLLFFLSSLFVFILDSNNSWLLPTLGFEGFRVFLLSIPWLLILLSIILVSLLKILTKRSPIIYRRPLIYPLIPVILLALGASFIISQTSLHKNLNNLANKNQLPILGSIYRDFNPSTNNYVHVGIINKITDNGFTMINYKKNIITVITSQETLIPENIAIKINQSVIVFGKEENRIIKAIGISNTYFK